MSATRRHVYRDIGLRTCACGCGQQFMLSTFHRTKKYLNHAHATKGHNWSGINTKRAETVRLRKYGRLIARMMGDDRRITVAQIARLCEEAYRGGYGAGWLAAKKSQNRQKAAA